MEVLKIPEGRQDGYAGKGAFHLSKDLIPVLGNYLIKGEKIQVILEFMNGIQLCSHTSTKCIKNKKISEKSLISSLMMYLSFMEDQKKIKLKKLMNEHNSKEEVRN